MIQPRTLIHRIYEAFSPIRRLFWRVKSAERNSRVFRNSGFTLIELLIVVAIIAILAAIAVPSYIEAQTRAKVSRAQHDMRSIMTGIEAYRIDYSAYPASTNNPAEFSPTAAAYMGSLAAGMHTFKTRGPNGEVAGREFAILTTPIAYISYVPPDTFATRYEEPVTPMAYWVSPASGTAWILTSMGPDQDLFAEFGRGDTNASNPLSTAAQTGSPAALGDINEVAVLEMLDGVGPYTPEQRSRLREYLTDLTYDPTNGTLSSGDLFRMNMMR